MRRLPQISRRVLWIQVRLQVGAVNKDVYGVFPGYVFLLLLLHFLFYQCTAPVQELNPVLALQTERKAGAQLLCQREHLWAGCAATRPDIVEVFLDSENRDV